MTAHHTSVSYTNKSNAILAYSWRVGKAVYCCPRAVQCRSAVLVLGERLIYNGRGHAWASLGHWACVRLGHAIGPRHPSY